ncbi:MAG: queuosine precursor transporter [Minisyncoccia bacterium]
MTLALAILWTAVISVFALGSAWYVRKYERVDALLALYVTLAVASSIFASKTIAIDFGFAEFFAPGAVLIFSVTFLLTDIVNEKFGKREVYKMIFLGLLAQIAFLIFSYLVLKAVPAPFFTNQAAFETVFNSVPRVVIAGLIAFLVSELLDANLYQWFRNLTGGKHLWMRNAFSTFPAMAIDSIVFVTLAFWGVMPLTPLIIGLTVTKWLVGIVDIPFMYASRAIMRR